MKLAQDAYCKREGNRFLLGTGKVEKQVELTQEGQWLVRSHSEIARKEYCPKRRCQARRVFRHRGRGILLRIQRPLDPGRPGGVHRPPRERRSHSFTLEHSPLRVRRHYVVYPGTAVIRSGPSMKTW